MTERYPVQFMIRISEELRDKLEQDAIDQDRSLAYIARRILENHYGVSSKKETLSAYQSDPEKLFLTPAKRKQKPVSKKG